MQNIDSIHEPATTQPAKKKWTVERIETRGDGTEVTHPMEGEYKSKRAARSAMYDQAQRLRALSPGPGGTITPAYIISPTGKRTRA